MGMAWLKVCRPLEAEAVASAAAVVTVTVAGGGQLPEGLSEGLKAAAMPGFLLPAQGSQGQGRV
jgi:hypothetical protein